jgi:hypothetical protein
MGPTALRRRFLVYRCHKHRLRRFSERTAPDRLAGGHHPLEPVDHLLVAKFAHLICELDVGSHLAGVRNVQMVSR